ncbi:DNA-binding protein S1FA-like isoform X1 [Cucurbita moschata]|nr:DNA-binding protein S1FA-like isoform X1 [Cucurbita moschata]
MDQIGDLYEILPFFLLTFLRQRCTANSIQFRIFGIFLLADLASSESQSWRQPMENVMNDVAAKGFNPGLMVLLLVGGLLLIFLIGNYALYLYAQKNLPPKKKKPVSKKKMKRERLKQGVSAPGE